MFGFLGFTKKNKKKENENISFRAVVNTHRTNLNIRSTPSKRFSPITSAPKGARLLVYGREGDWYRVVYRGIKGYAYSDYVMPLDVMNNC
ncbi:MAG TPA: SH3 domain-containing protein [Clostridia bacterium]|nr:SH3 domain-containing protein [Clostridia bacterium]